MSPPPVYLTSDVHLGAVPSDTEASFHRWLEHAAARASEIVINGDLFDFWFEYRNAIPKGYDKTLDLLRRVVEGGVPIQLLGGNHDWWGGRHLRDEIGIDFRQDPVLRDLAGRRTLIAHGDGLGRGDLGYRALRWMLRSPLTVTAFRQLPPSLGGWLGERVSRTDARGTSSRGPNPVRVAELRRWALWQLEEDASLGMVAVGHTHLPELIEPHPGRWVLNSGDWVYRRTYAVLAVGEPPRLLDWTD